MAGLYPRRFSDDGTTVTLDVHGCGVEQAVRLIRRTAEAAYGRGRGSVVVIHGRSTSETYGPARTIKTALARALDEGAFTAWVAGPRWSDDGGRCTLWLRHGPATDRTRLRVTDVVGPPGRRGAGQ